MKGWTTEEWCYREARHHGTGEKSHYPSLHRCWLFTVIQIILPNMLMMPETLVLLRQEILGSCRILHSWNNPHLSASELPDQSIGHLANPISSIPLCTKARRLVVFITLPHREQLQWWQILKGFHVGQHSTKLKENKYLEIKGFWAVFLVAVREASLWQQRLTGREQPNQPPAPVALVTNHSSCSKIKTEPRVLPQLAEKQSLILEEQLAEKTRLGLF